MVVWWNLIGIFFVVASFWLDDERKFFALVLGNMFIIGAVLYAKLDKILEKLK